MINIKGLTFVYRCKMRHSRKEDFKIIKCKLFNNYRLSPNQDALYFESKILKEWPELKQRFPTLDKIRIEYSNLGQNHLMLYEKDKSGDNFIAVGYMTLVGVEDG